MQSKITRFILATLAITTFIACTQKPDGSELIGKWIDKKGPDKSIEFLRDGNVMFIVVTDFRGVVTKSPLTINPDSTASMSTFLGATSIAYAKSTDTVQLMGRTLTRAN